MASHNTVKKMDGLPDGEPTLVRTRIPSLQEIGQSQLVEEMIEATTPREAISLSLNQPVQSDSLSKQVAKNLVIQSIGKVYGYATAILTIAFTTSVLSVSRFGDYSIVVIYLSFISTIAEAGVLIVGVREAAKYPENFDKILSTSFALKAFFAIIAFIFGIGAIFFFPYTTEVKIGVIIYGFSWFFLALCSIFDMVFQLRQQPRYPTLSEFALKTAIFIGTFTTYIVATKLQYSNQQVLFFIIIGTYSLANIAMGLVKCFGGFSQVRIHLKTLDWSYMKYLLLLSIPMGINNVLGQIHFKADAILLSILKVNDTTQVAVYNFAYRIIEILFIFFVLFVSMLFPIIAQYSNTSGEEFRKAIRRMLDSGIFLSLPIMTGIILLAPDIVNALSNGKYALSAYPLQILSVGVVFMFINMLNNLIIIVDNKQKNLIWISVIVIIANLSLNFYVIPIYSYNGSAFATDITEGLGMLSTFFIVYRSHRVFPSGTNTLKVFCGVISMAIAIIAFKSFIHFPSFLGLRFVAVSNLIVEGLVGIIVYLGLLFALRGVDSSLVGIVQRRLPFLVKKP